MLNDVMMEAADPLQFCTLAAAMRAAGRRTRGAPGTRRRAGAGRARCSRCWSAPTGTAELVGRFGTARRAGRRRPAGLHASTGSTPGDTLLLYTDGVTERRRGREQFGAEPAARGRGRRGRAVRAAQLVGAVREAVERFSPDPLDDDVALLAVRAEP